MPVLKAWHSPHHNVSSCSSFRTLATGPSYTLRAWTTNVTEAMIITPANITTAQFIWPKSERYYLECRSILTEAAFGWLNNGQKPQKKAHRLYTNAIAFIGGPYFPNPPVISLGPAFFPNSLHRAGGRGSPRSRLTSMHAMEIVYVAISATTETDRNALNAVVEPMLMSDMTSVNSTVKMTEFIGTRNRSSTRASHLEKTMPLSRAKAYQRSALAAQRYKEVH